MKLTIDLPFPPSVNAVWRSNRGRVHRDKKYSAWESDAWGHWLQQKPTQKLKSIEGHYALKIILNPPDKRRRDLGNYDKALSDFLQTAGIVHNDCLCLDLHIVWGGDEDAPLGARLILEPVLQKNAPAR